MKTLKDIVSGNIKEIRESKTRPDGRKWSQQDLATASGLSMRGIQHIESGEAWPESENLEAIAKALGVDAARLFSTSGPLASPEEALAIIARELRAPLPKEPIFEAVSLLTDYQKDILAKALTLSASDTISLLLPTVRRATKKDSQSEPSSKNILKAK